MTLAFRTLLSPWAALVGGVLIISNNIVRWGIYEGEWLWAVDLQFIANLLAGPILIAAVSVDVSRASRAGNRHLALLRPRRFLQYWYISAITMTVLGVVYLMALAGVGAYVLLKTGTLAAWPVALLQIVAHFAWNFFCIGVGAFIGRFLKPLLAGVIGILVGFMMLNLQITLPSDGFALAKMGGAMFTRIGMTYNLTYVVLQILIFVALGILLVFAPVRIGVTRLVPTVSAICVAALAVVAMTVSIPGLPSERWVAHAVWPTNCVQGATEVCGFPEHPDFQDELVSHALTLETAAATGGFSFALPTRISEARHHSSSYSVSDSELAFEVLHTDEKLDLETIVTRLYSAEHCDERSADVVDEWLENYFTATENVAYTFKYHAEGYYEEGVDPLTPDQMREYIDQYVNCSFGEDSK